ncbi:unnamed protein product, partial [Discosporangium mesarthrocarpum]
MVAMSASSAATARDSACTGENKQPGEMQEWSVESGLLRSSDHRFVRNSPHSMMLTSGENEIMRMPDFNTFMVQQENLQSLLLDIHEDPMGFILHVKDRREKLDQDNKERQLVLDPVGEGTLLDFGSLREVGKGRFSTVFYAEHKETGMPVAVKRLHLSSEEGGKGEGQAEGDGYRH